MLNFCYIYSIIWTVVLVLYSLHWSDLCYPIDTGLLLFFVSTIIVSFLVGYLFRSLFKFEKMAVYPNRGYSITTVIILICFFEYFYCGQIPFFAILMGTHGYTDFTGIPTIHTIVNTFSSFYAQYLFYLIICFPEKRKQLITEYASILIVAFLFQFNRGQLLINLFISVSMLLAARQKSIGVKQILWFLAFILITLYIFGGLGNLRSGYSWGDSSYISNLGWFNNNYPTWLPEQFMWSYSYITSPLVNVNYNVCSQYTSPSVFGTLISILPDFIAKRLFPAYFLNSPLLEVDYFTAVSAFANAYLWGDYLGLVFFFIILIFGQIIVFSFVRVKRQYRMPFLAMMCAIVAFTFFTHTISYSAISFMAVYPLLTIFRI